MTMVCESPRAKSELGAPAICVNCGRNKYLKARGLCGRCYEKKEIRDKYPPIKMGKVDRPGLCLACQLRPPERARGLCQNCYYTPEIRDQHPLIPNAYRRHEVEIEPSGTLPESPTTAAPGTEEKLLVLAERASRGEYLFHPDDAIADIQTEQKRKSTYVRKFHVSASLCKIDSHYFEDS